MDRPPTYPVPARPERLADGAVHAAGVAFALGGAGALALIAASRPQAPVAVALAVYGCALIATFLASALYHLAPWHRLRPVLRRLDHAAIFLKIAGTTTPLAVLLSSWAALALLVAVWLVALAGALAKLLFWREPGRAGVLLYLALGWAALPLVWPLATTLPWPVLALVAAGGLLYSAGAAVFAAERWRFTTAIWHGFVLAASGCFYAAIAVGTLSV